MCYVLNTYRYAVAILTSLIVAFSLFWLMQYLVDIADKKLDTDDPGQLLEFVRIPPTEEVIKPPERLPPKPPDPDVQPPQPPDLIDDLIHYKNLIPMNPGPVDHDFIPDRGGGIMAHEGDYLPIVIVQPQYPRQALRRNLEGYTIVELTVTEAGTTKDIRVIESVPAGVFDKASVKAAAKFKYKPRVIQGQPIEVPGVPYKFTFTLKDE